MTPADGAESEVVARAVTLGERGAAADEVRFAPGEVVTVDVLGGTPGAAPEASSSPAVPDAMALRPVSPNPSSGTAVVRYEVSVPGDVRVVVYDALGREVSVLTSGAQAAGRYASPVSGLAPGVYVVRMTVGSFSATQRLTVVR